MIFIYVFYIDLFLEQNFLMNLIVLMFCASLRGSPGAHRLLRLLLAGICGVLIMALLVLFAPGYGWMTLGTALLAVPLMLFIAFEWGGGKEFCIRLLLSWFSIIVLNGVAEAWQNLTGIRALSLYGLLLTLPLVRMLVMLARSSVQRQARLYPVRLSHGGNSADTRALYDSGNLLTTADGNPVHIASPELFLRLGIGEEDAFSMIPYQSLGMERGWIRVARVERMQVGVGKSARILSEVWIGKAEEGLFRGKSYQMILNGGKERYHEANAGTDMDEDPPAFGGS